MVALLFLLPRDEAFKVRDYILFNLVIATLALCLAHGRYSGIFVVPNWSPKAEAISDL